MVRAKHSGFLNTMAEMIPTLINGRWTVSMPDFRAERTEWQTGWEVARLDSMYANIKPGMVIYDIGTEEGELSALFASWCSPGGGIVLCEPNPAVWPCIRNVWEANGLEKPLACYHGFIGPETTNNIPLDAHVWPRDSYELAMVKAHGFARMIDNWPRLPRLTIDDIPKRLHVPPPDVLTMDIEGSEYEAARGMLYTLKRYRPLIWISVHPAMIWDDYGEMSGKLHNQMKEANYLSYFLGFDHEEHWFYYPRERSDSVVLP